jgi:hypothetical protein
MTDIHVIVYNTVKNLNFLTHGPISDDHCQHQSQVQSSAMFCSVIRTSTCFCLHYKSKKGCTTMEYTCCNFTYLTFL